MKIIVTKHAIEQYRKKMFNFDISENEIRGILSSIARNGKQLCKRPTINNPVYEVNYQKLSIVVEYTKKTATVITFLGDRRYQNWARQQEIAPRYA